MEYIWAGDVIRFYLIRCFQNFFRGDRRYSLCRCYFFVCCACEAILLWKQFVNYRMLLLNVHPFFQGIIQFTVYSLVYCRSTCREVPKGRHPVEK